MNQKVLTDLVNQGLISLDQKEKIDSYFRQKNAKSGWSFSLILSIFGGIMISAGILLWVSLNWDSIPDLIKTIFLFIIMIATFIGALLRTKYHDDVIAASLRILASGSFGANIFLQGQIYNLGGQFFEAFGLRFLGTLPLAFFTKMRTVFVGSIILFFIRYVSWLGHFDVLKDVRTVFAMISGFGFMLLVYNTFHRNERGYDFGILAEWIGETMIIFSIPLFFFRGAYDEWHGWGSNAYYLRLLFVFPCVSVLIWMYSFFRGLLHQPSFFFLVAGIHVFILSFIAVSGFPFMGWYGLGLIYGLALALYVIWVGTKKREKYLTTLGNICLRFFVMAIYGNHFSDAGVGGLIGGGIVAIVSGYLINFFTKKLHG